MADHITTTRVRFGETDKMGIVYHANFIVYFELGRTEGLAVLAWAPARIVTPPPAEGTVIRPATGGWVFPDERDQSRHGWRSGPRSRLAGAGRLGSGARLAQLGPQPRGLGPEILPLLVRGLEGVQPALGLLELSLQGVL